MQLPSQSRLYHTSKYQRANLGKGSSMRLITGTSVSFNVLLTLYP